MGKRRKLGGLPSTSKAEAGNPDLGNVEGPNQDPAGAPLNPTTGSGNGGHVDPDRVPDANRKPLNPLDMPEILAHIFKLCSPEVLPNCRLVSKAWAAESLNTWRSSATLQFHYPGGNEIFLMSGENGTEEGDVVRTPLGQFLNFWKAECNRKPFHRFKLSKWEFALGSNNATTKGHMTNRFWKLTGSHMTTLILKDCAFSGAKVLRKIIFEACPNLQELALDGCGGNRANRNYARVTLNKNQIPEHGELVNLQSLSVNLKERGHRKSPFLPISWLELFSRFPALTTLELSFELQYISYATYGELIQQLISAIKLVKNQDGRKLPLRSIRIHMDFELRYFFSSRNHLDSLRFLPLLRELNVPLEFTVLSFNLTRDDIIMAMETITSSRTSLTSLEAQEEFGDLGNDIWDFPFDTELPNLESLKMSHRFCHGMQFLQYTPNLKKLQVMGERNYLQTPRRSLETHLVSQTIQSGLADVRLLNLKELYFDFELKKDADLQSLIGWLPNVELLTMYLTDKQFGIVCDKWRKLEHLHVLGGRLTDWGITGRRGGRNSGEGNGITDILPNISYLTGLKCFKILAEVAELTDVSAFEGFLKLPDLKILSIRSPRIGFGGEAYAALRSKIPTCELSSGHLRAFGGIQIRSPTPTYPNFRCNNYLLT